MPFGYSGNTFQTLSPGEMMSLVQMSLTLAVENFNMSEKEC